MTAGFNKCCLEERQQKKMLEKSTGSVGRLGAIYWSNHIMENPG
jgi:hypothetical protein